MCQKPACYCFTTKTLKFRRGVRGIDWVICMCCWGSWNVSENTRWWMCLWPGAEPSRGADVGAGNVQTASRLPAWHQNRWMPLIVTVCNVCSSIIPFPPALRLSRWPEEAACRVLEQECVSRDSGRTYDFIYHTGKASTYFLSWNVYSARC